MRKNHKRRVKKKQSKKDCLGYPRSCKTLHRVVTSSVRNPSLA